MGCLFVLCDDFLALAIMGGVLWLLVELLATSAAPNTIHHRPHLSLTYAPTPSPSILPISHSKTNCKYWYVNMLHFSPNKSHFLFLFYPFTHRNHLFAAKDLNQNHYRKSSSASTPADSTRARPQSTHSHSHQKQST